MLKMFFRLSSFVLLLSILFCGGAGLPAAWAQQPAAAPAAEPVPPEQLSPRAVLRSFLERMSEDQKKDAAKLLDLTALNPEAAAAKGPELAYKLYTVMQRTVRMPPGQEWPPVDNDEGFSLVPAEPDYEGAWTLSDLKGYANSPASQIKIVRDGNNWWRFSADTVASIEKLYANTEESEPLSTTANGAKTTVPFQVWFANQWPKSLQKQHFLMPTYQWISLLLIAVIARVTELVSRRFLTLIADALLHHSDPDFDESTSKVWKPVGRLANAGAWYAGASFIGLPLEVVGVMLMVLKLVTILAAVGAAFAIINLTAEYMNRRAKRTERKCDNLIVPVAATTLRVIVVVLAVIVGVATFIGTVPSALLGGLGIGGVAIALASQETLSNFFGSLTVLFDRPFEVGDFVIIEGVQGEVESLGFRSTRIRTGMNSQVTIPNSKLVASSVDNMGRRRYRRYLGTLGVQYDTTPEQIEAFCEGIRELVRRHPHTRKDFYAVYFNDFGDSALEVLLVVFFEAPDWATELRERHRLLADILRLAQRLGVEFAFPTQTLHLHRGEKPAGPPEMDNPEFFGQASAADIAGELLNYQDRPGRVQFKGPTPVESLVQNNGGLSKGDQA